jgi:hypothetical protein
MVVVETNGYSQKPMAFTEDGTFWSLSGLPEKDPLHHDERDAMMSVIVHRRKTWDMESIHKKPELRREWSECGR